MSWARLDDQMPDDPKVSNLSNQGFRAYVTAICFSARTLSDGVLTARQASGIAGKRVLPELVPLLWHEGGGHCDSEHCQHLCGVPPGSFLIHNYLKYNATREKVLADRERNNQRMKAERAGPLQAHVQAHK